MTARQAGLEAFENADFRCSEGQGGVIDVALIGRVVVEKKRYVTAAARRHFADFIALHGPGLSPKKLAASHTTHHSPKRCLHGDKVIDARGGPPAQRPSRLHCERSTCRALTITRAMKHR